MEASGADGGLGEREAVGALAALEAEALVPQPAPRAFDRAPLLVGNLLLVRLHPVDLAAAAASARRRLGVGADEEAVAHEVGAQAGAVDDEHVLHSRLHRESAAARHRARTPLRGDPFEHPPSLVGRRADAPALGERRVERVCGLGRRHALRHQALLVLRVLHRLRAAEAAEAAHGIVRVCLV